MRSLLLAMLTGALLALAVSGCGRKETAETPAATGPETTAAPAALEDTTSEESAEGSLEASLLAAEAKLDRADNAQAAADIREAAVYVDGRTSETENEEVQQRLGDAAVTLEAQADSVENALVTESTDAALRDTFSQAHYALAALEREKAEAHWAAEETDAAAGAVSAAATHLRLGAQWQGRPLTDDDEVALKQLEGLKEAAREEAGEASSAIADALKDLGAQMDSIASELTDETESEGTE